MSTTPCSTALVTGASRGIGRAIAERLAADGFLVGVHYCRSAESADEVVAGITEDGGRAFSVGADFAGDDAADRLWAEFDAQYRQFALEPARLDVLVNNVGVAKMDRFANSRAEDLDHMYAVNVRTPYLVTQQALRRLRDGGRVVNISSAITRLALPDGIGYGATKGAVETFTLILAKELGPRGITVNAVSPGFVDTDANAGWLAPESEVRASIAAQSVFNRVGAPSDVADVVGFLASPQGRWVTGQVIDASGGTRL
jgi:NAD(P)-dependent dehydrogenase (short-subunit alcohol dehydrogenase family)